MADDPAVHRVRVPLRRSGRQALVANHTSDTVSLVVADNGVGFDTGRLNTVGGLGLVMMRERASQLNGTFHFETVPHGGTTIRVAIPFR